MSKQTPSYYELVYQVVESIPKGRVTTYGHIADFLTLGSARMVGYALRQLGGNLAVPAHRVVNSQGQLTGKSRFRPPEKMVDLLADEGIAVKNDRIVNFKKLVWIPSKEF